MTGLLLLAGAALLVAVAAPAGLLLWARRGGRDPYDVTHLYAGDSPAARRRRARLGLDRPLNPEQ